jgi:TIR domain
MTDIATSNADKFFVSYNKEDKDWAEWIAWVLEEANYKVFIQAWDIRPGNNFVIAMQTAAASNIRTVAVLSSHYLVSRYTQPEWASAFNQDPTGEKGILLPVKIEQVELNGLWLSIVYIDLVGLSQEEAKRALLEGVALKRAKPMIEPTFPGKKNEVVKKEPHYPSNFSKEDPLKDWTVLKFGLSLQNNEQDFIFSVREKLSRIVNQSTLVGIKGLIDLLLSQKNNTQSERFKKFQILYELLIPTEFRESFFRADKFCIFVDKVTAIIPWEGIFAFSNSLIYKPIQEKTEIIRQVMVNEFRVNSSFQHQHNALIIQFLDNNKVQNKAKGDEAISVSSLLINSGFNVKTKVTDNTSEIIMSLFEDTYKMLHIEGIVHFNNNETKGIRIGSDIYLTPMEFSQMSVLPQMIYIDFNLEADIYNSNDNESIDLIYQKVASVFATKLISMGVKSLVISSGPLDKIIRLTFAKTFYQALLNGVTFSHATKVAKQAIFEIAPTIKSLEGFQCYGEVDFILMELEKKSLISNDNKSKRS